MPWNTGPTSRGIVARHGVESALVVANAQCGRADLTRGDAVPPCVPQRELT